MISPLLAPGLMGRMPPVSAVNRTTALSRFDTPALEAEIRARLNAAAELNADAVTAVSQRLDDRAGARQFSDSQRRFFSPERETKLADLLRPRPALSPADEVALFSINTAAQSRDIAIEAMDASSRRIDAVLLAAAASSTVSAATATVAKSGLVAAKYAAAHDITFSSDHFVNHAA